MTTDISISLPSSPPPAKKAKLGGYDFYRSIGSPRYVVAPMVDQSELAWRLLSRSPLPPDMAGPSSSVTGSTGKVFTRHQGGAHLVYTPMINAKSFAQSKAGLKGMDPYYNTAYGEEGCSGTVAGVEGGDAPVFVQFCANDPETLLKAAKRVENRCDAVDINFGCPQGIARRGHYGSFLQDEWDLIKSLIGILHENLSVPVTAKFRIHPSLERTIAYAKMMEAAGAQILTCHGRTREMKGQLTGLADWEIIRQVKLAVNIPVFANGNILYYEDVERCLEVTGCDGVMTAEGNLFNPSIFLPPSHPHMHPPSTILAHRYLDIVAALKTPTANSAIKSHIFRMLKPILDAQPDEKMRERIGKARDVEGYRAVIRDMESLVQDEVDAAGPSWRAPSIDPATGYRTLPIWAAQPYIRQETVTITAAGAVADAAVTSDAPTASPTAATMGQGVSSAVSAVVEPDTVPTATTTPAPGTPIPPTLPTPAQASSSAPTTSAAAAAAALHCSQPDCTHQAASRCPHRACLTHCRSISVLASPSSGLTEEEAIMQARRGLLDGKGCEAHEEKVRARAERQKEQRLEKAARGQAARARKKEHEEGRKRNLEAREVREAEGKGRGVKRQASAEADERERVEPVHGAAAERKGGEGDEEAALNGL